MIAESAEAWRRPTRRSSKSKSRCSGPVICAGAGYSSRSGSLGVDACSALAVWKRRYATADSARPPVCGTNVQVHQVHQGAVVSELGDLEQRLALLTPEEQSAVGLPDQQNRLADLLRRRKASTRIVLEFGNTVTRSGAKSQVPSPSLGPSTEPSSVRPRVLPPTGRPRAPWQRSTSTSTLGTVSRRRRSPSPT